MHQSRDRWLQRRHLAVAQLLDLAPDIIAMQELALPIRQGQWMRNQLNARAGERSTGYRLVQRRRGGLGGLYAGVGILSRLPILSYDALTLSFGRIALRANVELSNGRTVDVVTTHLHPSSNAVQTRDEQVMRIVGWLDSSSAVAHRILLGNFRETPQGPAIQRMKTFFGFRSTFEAKWGREPVSTWPTALNTKGRTAGQCHDYIFVTPRIGEIEDAGLCCNRASDDDPTLLPSDHVGLFAKLTIS